MSDSEVEDDPNSKVILPQDLRGRGSTKAGSQSAIRMKEVGPRLHLQLMKIEEGVAEGEVLYHQYIQKTEEEKRLIRERREAKRYCCSYIQNWMSLDVFAAHIDRKTDEKVRKIQELQRKQREEKKALHREKSMEGMKRKEEFAKYASMDGEEGGEDDDDAEYYRREVGQEPEKGKHANPGC